MKTDPKGLMTIAPPNGRRVPILLVEDDFAMRRALDEFLTTEGFQVLCTATGAEALGVLDTYEVRAQLIILDIADAVRFRSVQQTLPLVRDIPIITLTADGSGRPAVNLGVQRVLKKPLDLAALLQAINELV